MPSLSHRLDDIEAHFARNPPSAFAITPAIRKGLDTLGKRIANASPPEGDYPQKIQRQALAAMSEPGADPLRVLGRFLRRWPATPEETNRCRPDEEPRRS